MCIDACIYIYTYIYIHTHIYNIYIYIYIHTHTHRPLSQVGDAEVAMIAVGLYID